MFSNSRVVKNPHNKRREYSQDEEFNNHYRAKNKAKRHQRHHDNEAFEYGLDESSGSSR